MRNTWRSKYFYGNKISEYGLENGYLDYRTLAQSFDAVLNNNIMQLTQDYGYWEQEHGFINNEDDIQELIEKIETLEGQIEIAEELGDDNKIQELQAEINQLELSIYDLEHEQDCMDEIFQYYIVTDSGAEIIKSFTNDPLFYNEYLDMYVWGITHFGTSWDYVLTCTELELDEC